MLLQSGTGDLPEIREKEAQVNGGRRGKQGQVVELFKNRPIKADDFNEGFSREAHISEATW